MKKLVTILVILSAQFTFAGVLEKKAIKAGDEAIAEKIKKFSKNCGAQITVKSNHTLAEKMIMDERTPDNMIRTSASVCADHISTLANLCEDKDYKEEIAKIKTINCMPNKALDKTPFIKVKNESNTYSIEHNPITNDPSGSYQAIKASF